MVFQTQVRVCVFVWFAQQMTRQRQTVTMRNSRTHFLQLAFAPLVAQRLLSNDFAWRELEYKLMHQLIQSSSLDMPTYQMTNDDEWHTHAYPNLGRIATSLVHPVANPSFGLNVTE